MFSLLYVQKVVSNSYSNCLYEIGQDFLNIQYHEYFKLLQDVFYLFNYSINHLQKKYQQKYTNKKN